MFRTAAVVLITTAAVSTQAGAQTPAGPLRLLDVPYLPQSVALCGGAAAAMVMRYWGATGVYAETFADLVIPEAGGIRGEDLLRALESRGWHARSFRGDPAFLQSHLEARRPVVALIEDRPGQFHYVVVVGWSSGRVIAHDPARAPFRIFEEDRFVAAWAKSGFWTMLALPGEPPGVPPAVPAARANDVSPVPPVAASASPCSAMVEQGVRLAGAGELGDARRLLAAAIDACPGSAAPWREIAGIHAVQGEWSEAAMNARRAIERDSTDAHAWRILATSLYLEDDVEGALAAWNAVGEPAIDLVDVKGLDRTRYGVVAQAMGLRPQTVLTPAALQTARRRLSQLPSAQTARVAFRPGDGGRAEVEAVVLERPLLPTAPLALAGTAVHLAANRELAVALTSPSGGGEVWTAAWRWWEARPRLTLEFATPAPFGGVWAVRGYSEKESYRSSLGPESGDGLDAGPIEERRRGVALSISRWSGTGLRIDGAAGFDRWSASRRAAALSIGARQMLAADHAYVEANVGTWIGGLRTWTLGARGEWRTSTRNEGHVIIGRGGVATAGEAAPLSLWHGAGTGTGRDVLLRGHPLLESGVVTGRVFGRTLMHGGAEWRRWSQLKGTPIRVAPAAFADTARAWRGGHATDNRWHLDVGVGLRVALPGAGVVRLDLGRGLRDGTTAFSIGLMNNH